ncbi:MAG: hypothetical protein H0T47_23735 [Planctomycetaceae bacterium]|nr:hypothetical protein [Planctomycetaceae bacterium]
MTEAAIPESRSYRHSRCQQETVVGGQSFEVVSNPMSSMEQTMCSTCGAMFPIAEYAWADTDESLSDYYARHTIHATPLQRFLCSKTFMVALIAIAAIAVAGAAYALVANDNWLTRLICVAGGLMIGAFIGMAIFVSGFANPIKRSVCGVSDTRLLR